MQTITDMDDLLRTLYHHLLTDGSGVCLWDRPIQHLTDREQHARSMLIRLELWVDPYEPEPDPPNSEVSNDGEEPHEAA